MSKIRVLHIITRMSKGGAQENTLLNATRMNSDRFESELVCGPSQGAEGDILDKVRHSRVKYTEIPELVREVSPLKDSIAFAKLIRHIRAGRYDIVHTHTSKAGILGRWAAWWSRVPVIVHSSHSHVFYGYFNPLVTRGFVALEKLAARTADSLQELTARGVQEHLDMGVGRHGQFAVVYSGQDLSEFLDFRGNRDELRRALGIAPDCFAICCVARLAPIKGHSYLLQAFAKLHKEFPKTKLLLAGSGELHDTLTSQAAALGIADHVVFCGMRTNIPALLAASDLFCLPSLNEGMGRALVEASASGLPVIGTRVGGIPEVVVEGKTGLLVPPADAEALREAMRLLLQNTPLRRAMGEAGKRFVHPRFSIESMISAIETDYLRLLTRKSLAYAEPAQR